MAIKVIQHSLVCFVKLSRIFKQIEGQFLLLCPKFCLHIQEKSNISCSTVEIVKEVSLKVCVCLTGCTVRAAVLYFQMLPLGPHYIVWGSVGTVSGLLGVPSRCSPMYDDLV